MTQSGAVPLTECADGVVARAVGAANPDDAAAAEAELYRRFAYRVRLFGMKHLADREAADDLAQQVMLVAITKLRAGEVRDPDQIASFVLGTSRLIAGGERRRERRRAALHARFDAGEEPTSSTSDLALDLARIGPCLASVRDRERTILLLTYYAERSAAEIARGLGTTPGAVRVGRHRALASMRECLEARRLP